jgi:hypothetical protein
MILDKAAILAADDLETVEVPVPEWGGTVRVRMMTGADRDAFELSMIVFNDDGSRKPNWGSYRARLVAFTLVDDQGNRMFAEDEIAHVAGKSAAVISRIFEAAEKLNGLGESAVGKAEKNSVAGLSEGSTSA